MISPKPNSQQRRKKNSPCALIVKEAIRPLLKLLRNILRLLVPLEPRLVLLVEAPALALERLRREELLVRALLVVEGVEEGVGVDAAVQARVVEDVERFLRVGGQGVGIAGGRLVVRGFLGVEGGGRCEARGVEEGHGVGEGVAGGGARGGFFEGVEEVCERGGEVIDGFLLFF